MSNITTLEQAKRLKKLGFSLSCANYYTTEHEDILYTDIPKDNNTLERYLNKRQSAPTIPEALDWIREEKGIHCSVSFVFKYNDRTDNVIAQYFGQVLQTFPQFIDQVTEDFDTHPLAESALLDAVLTYLENKGGE